MAIKIIDGNLFDTKAKFITHQVNCQKRMGSGVALQVKNRFPHVYKEYLKICSPEMLGKIQVVSCNPDYIEYDSGSLAVPFNEQYICNLFAQNYYGYDGKQYTSLEAFKSCLKELSILIHGKNTNFNATIAMPYKIGCDRGGANWEEIYKIIEETLFDCNVELWRLNHD